MIGHLVYEDWQHGTKNNLITSSEQDFLSQFQHYKNFKIVDRNVTDNIIEEHNFQLSGLIEDTNEIGKMLGATHLYIISFSRNPTNKKDTFLDTVNGRLVDIKDGHVVGVYQNSSYTR